MLTGSAERAPDGQPYQLTRLQNDAGMTVTLMDWGATWLSAELPLRSGEIRELLLGCRTPADYLRQSAYLGATVGRYANRIAHASLPLDGKAHPLVANQGKHQLHGGPAGFHARRWRRVQQDARQVRYALHSEDGDQGFPGNLDVQVCYRLTADNRLEIAYQAQTDRACPVNLTNHAYFNLDGAGSDARRQRLQLFADRYLPVDGEGIPSADLTPVEGSGMDFRQPKTLLQDFLRDRCQQQVKGYDHAYLLHRTCGALDSPAAHLWSADNRVQMSVFTSAPALQLYSGNHLAGTPARDGGSYANYAGVALESEFLPDSPHHPEWPQPSCWLQPGQTYHSATHYQFYPI
ncbi:galactose-1-epimerase [Serratia entomophila]|uniref:galactose-1-epimerase n=1 Tax=Serratia entomophila TaxID=42906 RepID=UPI00217BA9A9|nr:galactose-1-epimerase [Serratia entomophila]CAI0976855.1 Aldose 1-epimerase [Serratia entomophila]CAI1761624.1 Aldose 1-epimerase [Serratia entomophila]